MAGDVRVRPASSDGGMGRPRQRARRRRSILMATGNGGGNLPPITEVARTLVARGHEVHMLAGPFGLRSGAFGPEPWDNGMKGLFEQVGCTVHLVPGQAWTDDATPLPAAEGAPTTPPEFAWAAQAAFLRQTEVPWAVNTARLIAELQPDVFAVDGSLFGAAAAGEAAGLPVAALYHLGSLVPLLPGRPVPFLGIQRTGWQAGSAADRAARRTYRALARYWWLPPINAARTRLGLAPLRTVEAVYRRMTRVLVLSSPAFAEPPPRLPRNMVYTGAPVPSPDPPAGREPVSHDEAGRPLVVVTGTTTSFAAMMRPYFAATIEALARLPVRGLVTAGPSLDPTVLPSAPNVEVRGYLPHAAVFPRAAAVVSHCGQGTVLTALRHGVPLVCLPAFSDQFDNAARVADLRAGVWVQGERTPEAIAAAVRDVLEDRRYRETAARLAQVIAREDGALTAARHIEALAGRRRRR